MCNLEIKLRYSHSRILALEVSLGTICSYTWVKKEIFKVALWHQWWRHRGQNDFALYNLPPRYLICSQIKSIVFIPWVSKILGDDFDFQPLTIFQTKTEIQIWDNSCFSPSKLHTSDTLHEGISCWKFAFEIILMNRCYDQVWIWCFDSEMMSSTLFIAGFWNIEAATLLRPIIARSFLCICVYHILDSHTVLLIVS